LILKKFIQLAREIVAGGRIDQGQIQGLSDHEIRIFEQRKGFAFPKAYVEFLSFCGKSGALELTDLDFKIEWDAETRSEIVQQSNEESSDDEGDAVLLPVNPSVAFPVIYEQSVFFTGDGHGVFYYFVAEVEVDDPEVFWWQDYREVRKTSQRFSDFVFSQALSCDQIKREHSNS
jgi:SMI1 / KNR4 family (SUKH-1)